jgi:hypothetical protein
MTQTATTASPVNLLDPQRLIAEQRERLIELEARGWPGDQPDELWNRMGALLADLKRQQAQ